MGIFRVLLKVRIVVQFGCKKAIFSDYFCEEEIYFLEMLLLL